MSNISRFTLYIFIFSLLGIIGLIINRTNPLSNLLGSSTSRTKQESWIVQQKINEADKILNLEPNPIEKINLEGKTSTDPLRLASVKSLEDVKRVFTLAYVYTQTNNNKYLYKADEYFIKWTNKYIANGNSIDESHLIPLIEAYSLVRSKLSSSTVNKTDTWLKTIAIKEMSSKYGDDRDINNWNSHRVNIIGTIGFVINDSTLKNTSVSEFKKQIAKNLNPDGTSHDLKQRDALHYHCYDIFPLLNLARFAKKSGVDLYSYKSESGSSLEISLKYLYPYFNGSKRHLDFVNSTASWDSESKKNPKYWDPKNGLYVLEEAYFLEPSVLPLIQKIRSNNSEIPSFEVLYGIQQKEIFNAQTKL